MSFLRTKDKRKRRISPTDDQNLDLQRKALSKAGCTRIYEEKLSGVLRQLMEEHGMSASELGRLLCERSLGVKILKRHRELSKSHIRKLADYFKLSADLFL